MKRITCHYKKVKIRNIKIAVLAVFVSIFFLPSFVPFEKTGNNIFTVILNNQEAGTVSTPQEAEAYAVEARRQLAMGNGELVLVESDLETVGREVLWGKTDTPSQVVGKMKQILAGDVKETLHRS